MKAESMSQTILEREFLPVRAKILEIAASLDRMERAEGDATIDPRWQQLRSGIDLLLQKKGDRAEHIQMLFSLPFDAQWRDTLEVGR